MRFRPTEVKAVEKILVNPDEYDSAEDAAKAIIQTLEEMRSERTTYAGVLQMGTPGKHITFGTGPHETWRAAEKAVKGHPAASEASVALVVPLQSEAAFYEALKALDIPPDPPEMDTEAKGFWAKVSAIRDHEVTAITGNVEIKPVKIPKV